MCVSMRIQNPKCRKKSGLVWHFIGTLPRWNVYEQYVWPVMHTKNSRSLTQFPSQKLAWQAFVNPLWMSRCISYGKKRDFPASHLSFEEISPVKASPKWRLKRQTFARLQTFPWVALQLAILSWERLPTKWESFISGKLTCCSRLEYHHFP